MSRPLRLEYFGSLHHVTSRGNNKQNIFLDDQDRDLFLALLGTAVKRFSWILTAYVLMTNHFHFVVQLTRETMSRGVKWLNGEYVKAFNRRHGRVGHLYQGRPDIRLVEQETYGLELLRYVVLNPVRARMVLRPEDYVWSSHRAVIADVPAPDWLAVDDLLINFGSERALARAAYRDFVNAGIGVETSIWKDLFGQIYLGSEDWRERVRERVDLKPRCDEHPSQQRYVGAPTMSVIITAVANAFSIDEGWIRYGRGGTPRMVAAWIAWHEGNLTNTEIAASLRLRCAGWVSKLVQQCDRELLQSSDLQERIDRCLSTLRGKLTTKGLTP